MKKNEDTKDTNVVNSVNQNNDVNNNEDETSTLKQLKEKSVKFLKTTKGKIVYGVGIASVILGGIFFYNHYENTKPIGNGDTVVTSQDNSKDKRGRDIRAKDVLAVQADGSKSNDRGFKYLFESPIAAGIEAFDKKDKDEFIGSSNFIKNMITLLTTKDIGDVNSAAALYARNASNYKFTTDDNVIAVGIGRDATLFYNYLKDTEGTSASGRLELERRFASKFKERIATPYSGIAIASNLSTSGLEALVEDDISTAIVGQVQFIGSKQFKNYDDVVQNSKKINIETTYKNATLDAWNSIKNINSVYEVYLKDLSNGRDVLGVVTEDQNGRLSIYGLYYTEIFVEDQRVRPVREMRKAGIDTGSATEKDINWNTFREYVN